MMWDTLRELRKPISNDKDEQIPVRTLWKRAQEVYCDKLHGLVRRNSFMPF